ncbi:MAG TPA: hypothetical protein VGN97_17675 [Mesorhizobium sp.]|jgi:hypothetical protein|nr:hypothetical protein [Mesorhizobium sp.]
MRRVLLAGLAAVIAQAFVFAVQPARAAAEECTGENCPPASESSGKRGCGRDEAATS